MSSLLIGKAIESRYYQYRITSNFLPWLAVFFLFFSEHLSVDQVVQLGALYYLAVVVFEVPSGYLSDTIGRRPTLIISALSLLLAYVLYANGSGFMVFAAAQILLAAGIAFQSGSDTALLYDHLLTQHREDEFSDIESRALKYGMLSLAVSCVLGGLLGSLELRYVYIMAMFAAVLSIWFLWQIPEPPQHNPEQAQPFIAQLRQSITYHKHPVLLWCLLLFILAYSLQHVPYEFYQPWLTLLGHDFRLPVSVNNPAALTSGLVIAISMFGGAIGASASSGLHRMLGFRWLVVVAIGVQILIIGAMGLWLSAWVALLIMARNFSMSMMHSPLLACINPHVPSAQRATVLSMHSLAGRLAFSIALYMMSKQLPETGGINWPDLSRLLLTCASVAVVLIVAVVVLSRSVQFDCNTSE